MPKISIIIPVYNTSEYLRECLDSVIKQTLEDIEIILVDDGSTDTSIDICKEYAADDSRIKIIQQKNGGAAAARRTGAMAASSPYIGFVDSDDTIEGDMYETLLNHMGDCDLVTSVVRRDNGVFWKDYLPTGIYSSRKEMQYIIDNMLVIGESYTRGICGSMVCKLFKTDLAKLVFDNIDLKIFSSEDSEFTYRYILYCKAVCITDEGKYHYRNRDGSLVHSVHHDYLLNLNFMYLSLRDAFMGHEREDRLLEQLQILIMKYVLGEMPTRMGFTNKVKQFKFINPLVNEMSEKKIALYGAGGVGEDYYLYLQRMGKEPVLWVDKQYERYQEKYPVKSVESLKNVLYDLLLVAVKDKEVADKIKEELISKGIEEDKIVWKEPIMII